MIDASDCWFEEVGFVTDWMDVADLNDAVFFKHQLVDAVAELSREGEKVRHSDGVLLFYTDSQYEAHTLRLRVCGPVFIPLLERPLEPLSVVAKCSFLRCWLSLRLLGVRVKSDRITQDEIAVCVLSLCRRL